MYFQGFDTNSRIWIYQSNRPLTETEQARVTTLACQFAEGWTAHNQPLKAAALIAHGLFLVFCVDETRHAVSGCGIDKSVHAVQEIGRELGLDFFNRLTIAYLVNGQPHTCSMAGLKQLLASGNLPADTPVFINSLQTLAELNTRWPQPAHQTFLASKTQPLTS